MALIFISFILYHSCVIRIIISILNEVIGHIGVFNAAIGGLTLFKLGRGCKPNGFLNEIT